MTVFFALMGSSTTQYLGCVEDDFWTHSIMGSSIPLNTMKSLFGDHVANLIVANLKLETGFFNTHGLQISLFNPIW